MCFIKYVLRIPLRMSEEQLLAGDDMIHGEAAYVLGPCEAHEHLLAEHYSKRPEAGQGDLAVTLGRDPHEHIHDKSSGTGSNDIKND
jgi:Amt family ammonium transporter